MELCAAIQVQCWLVPKALGMLRNSLERKAITVSGNIVRRNRFTQLKLKMEEIKLYKIPLKGLKIFALTIPFVAIGIWMINKEQVGTTNYIMGWLSTCFFGLGIVVGFFQIFDRKPQIIITENGIWDRTTKQGEVKRASAVRICTSS
ncbi:hypothetical protein P1X15_13800 [Runella sp. MFBS21]|uniref:STM3941 family protein n=1 Tax=Runella sp. MFBS21 TaxID=3034018 RepID=UPI0023F70D82|nr:STM3941 family protein [Runella sp. MFBS21]MDF7818685.1 hypothetical protein [Runella sp. MFBS21]